jgi:hypothetical protein
VILRGTSAPRLSPPPAPDGNGSAEIESAFESVDEVVTEEPQAERPVPNRGGPAKPRTYRKPEAVTIDLNAGEKPWKDFAAEKGPTSQVAPERAAGL